MFFPPAKAKVRKGQSSGGIHDVLQESVAVEQVHHRFGCRYFRKTPWQCIQRRIPNDLVFRDKIDKRQIRLIDEDVSRRTIAVSIKATKLTGRVLAQACLAVGRKIKKAHRARQTPHGKQTVRKLMGHGAATNSIEVESPKDFDRVARRWNVDYAFYKTGPDKYLLFFKSGQADAITACFSEYSRRVLKRSKSQRVPIREQLKRAAAELARQPSHKKERAREAVHEDR